jgi:hypothetical protein
MGPARWRAEVWAALTWTLLTSLASARAEDLQPRAASMSPLMATGVWAIAQLVPSPLLAIGNSHVGFGVRWQVTPLLYSFGISERPLRAFRISPIARYSGSIELHASPEWSCCAPDDRSSWLLRTGLRVYLPILEHGEVLSWSFGSSYYRAAEGGGVSWDLGLYTLFGVLGLNLSVSPWLARREVSLALAIRYF